MFVTFAFPYMNGPLHLGHLYTMLQGWVAGRVQDPDNLQMPFGFHCTGMPIYASAMKLKAGDASVHKMLTDVNVPESEIQRFVDPEHWVRYFPARALETLKVLAPVLPGLDLKTCFVTTSINPYFDSFVRWQFTQLKQKGLVYFGVRPCIYSVKDAQPCAAHDRQIGEDATIQTEEPLWLSSLTSEKRLEYLELSRKHQSSSAQLLFPSEKVISRSGDLCIVAITEQWFIRYSDPVWKSEVVNYIKNELTVHDEEVKANLVTAAENLHDWCCSREYGLGTRIPWDERFLIDSLSDSTIYPVYYRFVDLLQTDTWTGTEPVPDNEFWNKVFKGSDSDSYADEYELVQKLRERIATQDIRVSAKDLVNNHLVMMIYNSIAIDRRLLPREYRVNGYVRVNGEKMSKSLGNFITVENAVRDYPLQALLVCLLEAGDGTNDANVRISDITLIDKALKEVLNNSSSNSSPSIAPSNMYGQILQECWQKSQSAWKRGRNREALAYGWRKCYKAYEKYSNDPLDRVALSIIRYTLRPVIGCELEMTDQEIAAQLAKITPDADSFKLTEFLDKLQKQLASGPPPNAGPVSTIQIHRAVLTAEGNMERVMNFLEDRGLSDALIIDETPLHAKRDPYKVKVNINYQSK